MIRVMLSSLLGDRKMCQADLARLTDIRPNTINALYHGYAPSVKFEHLDKICRALDCQLHELITDIPDNKADIDQSSSKQRR